MSAVDLSNEFQRNEVRGDGPVNERDAQPPVQTPASIVFLTSGEKFVCGVGDLQFHPKGLFCTGHWSDEPDGEQEDRLFFDANILNVKFDFASVLGEEDEPEEAEVVDAEVVAD